MAMKRESGASKKPAKGKATASKSRGSKTAVQMGNMNQMEAVRQKANPTSNISSYRAKKTVATSKGTKLGNKNQRLEQRAGGSKNKSTAEMKSKGNRKDGRRRNNEGR
jgi:hypothetical protein